MTFTRATWEPGFLEPRSFGKMPRPDLDVLRDYTKNEVLNEYYNWLSNEAQRSEHDEPHQVHPEL